MKTPRHTLIHRGCIWLLFLLLGLAPSFSRSQESPVTLLLRVGESAQLEPPTSGENVVVGNSRVIGAKLVADRLYVSGKASGFSTLQVGPRAYAVTVRAGGDPSDQVLALEQILADHPGVQVMTVSSSIYLVGEVTSDSELGWVQEVGRAFGAISLVRRSRSVLAQDPLVQVQLHFAQVARSLQQQVGLNWSDGAFRAVVTGAILGEGFYQLQAGVTGWELIPAADRGDGLLRLGEDTTHVHITDTHTLTVLDGEQDTYFHGQTQLVPLQGGLGGTSSLQTIDHGVKITVRPQTDDLGLIRLALTYEMSRPIGGVAGGLTLQKSQQATSVLLSAGEALGIATTTIRQVDSGRSGLPWLARLPLLGPLFGVHLLDRQESDGLVLITARRWRPGDAPLPLRPTATTPAGPGAPVPAWPSSQQRTP